MTYEWLIQPGDEVKVFPCDDRLEYYVGVVRHMPQATGDAWIIQDKRGVVTYQQTFNRIERIKKGEL